MKKFLQKIWANQLVKDIAVAFVAAMLIRTYVVQAYKIPTGSMIPTLNIGNRLLANKYVYRFKEPERGDVVIFRSPSDPKKDFIKRLAGLPGDVIEIKDGLLYINGELTEVEVLRNHYYYNQGDYGAYDQKIIVPEDSLFVLGDNSANSQDSRLWGFVPREMLKGRALLVYWPLNKMRFIR